MIHPYEISLFFQMAVATRGTGCQQLRSSCGFLAILLRRRSCSRPSKAPRPFQPQNPGLAPGRAAGQSQHLQRPP